MSILEKMKRYPGWSALGLGGGALVVDHFIRGDRSLASSLYRSFTGSGEGESSHGALPGAGARGTLAPGAVPGTIPGSIPFGAPESYYYPSYGWDRWGEGYPFYGEGRRFGRGPRFGGRGEHGFGGRGEHGFGGRGFGGHGAHDGRR